MRTLWVCDVSGGPFKFTATKPGTTPLGLEEAHRDLRISPAEFDEVAAELGRSLDSLTVPKPEKAQVLAAFAAHKGEVTAGYVETQARLKAYGARGSSKTEGSNFVLESSGFYADASKVLDEAS